MLELQGIAKRLGTLDLADLSLALGDGEYFVLLGPSGVGKTVLLEIIAGLLRPDSGRILWDGREITNLPPENRGFAVVYQDYALFPHLTVRQNISYGLHGAKADGEAGRRRVDMLVELLHIQDLLPRRPATLSGGEQQRVALARALAIEPRLLLLDEPLAALDTNTRLRLRKELKRINRELKTTILHVTHDPGEAMALGDRLGVMLDRRLRQVGEPDELFRRPSDPDVARFLGMWNVFSVASVDDGVCLVHGQPIHVSSADASTSHIWIAPEELLLSREPFESSARNQFECRVLEWDQHDSLLAVRVAVGELHLAALITHRSFQELDIQADAELYVTFKSSAVHCF